MITCVQTMILYPTDIHDRVQVMINLINTHGGKSMRQYIHILTHSIRTMFVVEEQLKLPKIMKVVRVPYLIHFLYAHRQNLPFWPVTS